MKKLKQINVSWINNSIKYRTKPRIFENYEHKDLNQIIYYAHSVENKSYFPEFAPASNPNAIDDFYTKLRIDMEFNEEHIDILYKILISTFVDKGAIHDIPRNQSRWRYLHLYFFLKEKVFNIDV